MTVDFVPLEDVLFPADPVGEGGVQAEGPKRTQGALRPRTRRAAPPEPARPAAYEDTPKWAKRRRSSLVQKLRSVPILACTGTNGSGKSALAAMVLLPSLRGESWHCTEVSHRHCDPIYDAELNPVDYGPNAVFEGYRLVYSTVEMTLPDGTPHPLYRRLNDWRMVIDAEHCDLLFDEVTGIANARDAMSLPRQVQVILDQLRKRDVRLIITAPSFQRMDTTLRTICKAIVVCKGYLPESARKRGDTVAVSAWRRMRLFRVRVFDGEDFETFNQSSSRVDAQKQYRLRPMFVRYWWGPGSEVFRSYSSKGAVARLGQQNDSGLCLECGGRRTPPRCTCST